MYEHQLREEKDVSDLEFSSVSVTTKFDLSELYLCDLTNYELFVIKFLYDVENFTNEHAFKEVQHLVSIEREEFYILLKNSNHYKSLSKILNMTPTDVKSIEKSAIIKMRKHIKAEDLKFLEY